MTITPAYHCAELITATKKCYDTSQTYYGRNYLRTVVSWSVCYYQSPEWNPVRDSNLNGRLLGLPAHESKWQWQHYSLLRYWASYGYNKFYDISYYAPNLPALLAQWVTWEVKGLSPAATYEYISCGFLLNKISLSRTSFSIFFLLLPGTNVVKHFRAVSYDCS